MPDMLNRPGQGQADIVADIQGPVGRLTLNRPQALNALSLSMVRDITRILLHWQQDDRVKLVALRGMGKGQPFGAFCAGGDIRFFHQAALAGDPRLEDFFTEEYQLNHLIHRYTKPIWVFMDGVIMGGGMGLAQGASLRIATEHTKMAMPETMIGLFPDVGGGFFLSRRAGCLGEFLGLTGQVLNGAQAVGVGLADVLCHSKDLPAIWDALPDTADDPSLAAAHPLWQPWQTHTHQAAQTPPNFWHAELDHVFGLDTVGDMLTALSAQSDDASQQALQALKKRSPLMLSVTLMQIRKARHMGLADALRMERDLVRHSFHTTHLGRLPATSETVEGIRALAIDKDHAPRWLVPSLKDVTHDMVAPFFDSPWPAHAHPLKALSDAQAHGLDNANT